MGRNKRNVKAVIFSDVHLAHYNKFNEGNRRLNNGLDVLRRIKLIAKVHKCPILFAGDFFDKEKHLTNSLLDETLPYLSKIYRSKKIMTYAISGNHDQSSANMIDNPSTSYVNTFSKIWDGLECIDFKSKDFGEWELHGVPYLTHDLGLIDYINEIILDVEKINVLMLHTTMPNVYDTDGRKMISYVPTNDFEQAIGRFDLVISGHIHKPMEFEVGKTKVIQVGAPQHQRFTDRGCDMGCWVMHGHDYQVEFISWNDFPKFVELEPGQQKPDNKNFYVIPPAKANKTISQTETKKFGVNLSSNKLARNYCKEKSIKDKVKRRALKNALKKVI